MCKYCERGNIIALKGGINVDSLKVNFLFNPSDKELITKVESSELCTIKSNNSQKAVGKVETKTEIKYCPFCGKKLGIKLWADIIDTTNENKDHIKNGLLDTKDNEKNILFVYNNNKFAYNTVFKFNNIYYYISLCDKTLKPIHQLPYDDPILRTQELIAAYDFNKEEMRMYMYVGDIDSSPLYYINIDGIVSDGKLHIECKNKFIKIVSNLELI